MCTTILSQGTKLYRYDVKKPPVEWRTDFKNIEYHYPDHGAKNLFGGFFFFQGYGQALNTGKKALNNNPHFNELWLSECHITSDIRLLDLTQLQSVTAAIIVMRKIGIDVLTDDFHLISPTRLFSELRIDIERYDEIVKSDKWWNQQCLIDEISKIIKHVEQFFIDNKFLGFFGQCLTDFENGIHFRNLLESVPLEGYMFNESNGTSGSNTICLLSDNYLSKPKASFITMHD